MALTDIVSIDPINCRMARGNGTLLGIVTTESVPLSCFMNRGNAGTITDVCPVQKTDCEIGTTSAVFPSVSDVKRGVKYGLGGGAYTGTLIIGGMATCYATLAKETGSNARGGSGNCAKLTPTSTSDFGYWNFYIPATQSVAFTFSFYHRISTAWNGVLNITIYDTDQTTPLLSSQSVTLTDDAAYHQFTSSLMTPSTTGMCLAQFEIKNGSTTGYVFIDDVGVNVL